MADKQVYEIQVTLSVSSTSNRWAHIRTVAELTKLPSDLFVGFTIANIPVGKEEEEKKNPEVEYRLVWSDTYPDVSYDVRTEDGVPVSCTCMDYQNRHKDNGGSCKHMTRIAGLSY